MGSGTSAQQVKQQPITSSKRENEANKIDTPSLEDKNRSVSPSTRQDTDSNKEDKTTDESEEEEEHHETEQKDRETKQEEETDAGKGKPQPITGSKRENEANTIDTPPLDDKTNGSVSPSTRQDTESIKEDTEKTTDESEEEEDHHETEQKDRETKQEEETDAVKDSLDSQTTEYINPEKLDRIKSIKKKKKDAEHDNEETKASLETQPEDKEQNQDPIDSKTQYSNTESVTRTETLSGRKSKRKKKKENRKEPSDAYQDDTETTLQEDIEHYQQQDLENKTMMKKNRNKIVEPTGSSPTLKTTEFRFHVPGRRCDKDETSVKSSSGGSDKQPARPKQTIPHSIENLEFYQNKIRSKPNPGHYIEEMLKWRGDYKTLEVNHRYIQWLFPVPESGGMNPQAKPLQQYEIEGICKSDRCRNRLVEAYEMMLDFYGMKLDSRETGELGRAKNWKKRFEHLNKSIHNYFRITRILKCIGCMGFVQYQKPLVMFFLNEIFVTRELSGIRFGALLYWIDSLHDKSDKSECHQRFQEYQANITNDYDAAKYNSLQHSKHNDKGSSKTKGNLSEGHRSPQNDTERLEEGMKNTRGIHKIEDVEVADSEWDAPVELQKGTRNESARSRRRKDQNLTFYRNEMKSKPSPGRTIEEILALRGNYEELKNPHDYIQWLFPVPCENDLGIPHILQPNEAKTIRGEKTLYKRGLRAYEWTLDLYGMKLDPEKPEKVIRAQNWRKRYAFLNSNGDNFKNISRMLESMRYIGLVNYQCPLVRFLMKEVFETKHIYAELDSVQIWIELIVDDQQRLQCYGKLFHLEETDLLKINNTESEMTASLDNVSLQHGAIRSAFTEKNLNF